MWVSYPKLRAKQVSDLSRDSIRERVEAMGWTTVTQVAVDNIWSALRLRPIEDVGKSR